MKGSITIVGLGPGSDDLVSPEVNKAILSATDIVGYKKYTKRITKRHNLNIHSSDNKYESNCGWPSFDQAIPNTIQYVEDLSHNMKRVEVKCSKCDGHLGHVFNDGPRDTTGKRYCINSAALSFNKK